MGQRRRPVEGVVMDPAFWNGKRVFVTGHTGFKGAWLSLMLEPLGAHVTGYALPPPTQPSLFDLAGLAGRMTSIEGDVRDADHLAEAMRAARPDVAVHMAAQALVLRSYQQPVETYATNVMGTVHFLEAARQAPGLRAAVVVTSDKCYENRGTPQPYREEDPMGGFDPYSSSKGCAELVVAAYRRSFLSGSGAAAVASVRAGNVIGGGDWAENRLVPDCMRAVLAGKPILIRQPQAVRPWQLVLEPLAGYLLLAERLWESGERFASAWNFGPADDEARPVGWIVRQIVDLWGGGASWQAGEDAQPHEAQDLRLDSSKARTELGWAPHITLSTALQWVVDWYKRYQAGEDVHAVCGDQIRAFRARGASA